MGKASVNKASVKAVKLPTTAETASHIAESSFSSGDLGQLQEILFGQQQRSTNEQMISLQKQFEDQLSCLSNVLNSRLNQLTETVEKYQINFDNRLDEMKTNSNSALKIINQNISANKAEMQTEINALSRSADEDAKRLETELVRHESTLLSVISDTKKDLQNGLNHSIDGLHSTKLGKQDLAQLLSDVSEKLSDTATTAHK